ncbi:hypothetical protein LCGC14_0677090 [marine sediment metagenome]|uniref:Uncharacterized protein n=1 Tax=marine sediment metagenome TaxID=412755 RepID=A0A0F9QP91_9ZZZZ
MEDQSHTHGTGLGTDGWIQQIGLDMIHEHVRWNQAQIQTALQIEMLEDSGGERDDL